MVGDKTWKEMNSFSKKQLYRLADFMGVGLNQPLDKDEIILVLSTESEQTIKKALKN